MSHRQIWFHTPPNDLGHSLFNTLLTADKPGQVELLWNCGLVTTPLFPCWWLRSHKLLYQQYRSCCSWWFPWSRDLANASTAYPDNRPGWDRALFHYRVWRIETQEWLKTTLSIFKFNTTKAGKKTKDEEQTKETDSLKLVTRCKS